MLLVSVLVPVHGMGVLFPTVLWTFKKANGIDASHFLDTYAHYIKLQTHEH